jgi:hypothetical protein
MSYEIQKLSFQNQSNKNVLPPKTFPVGEK